MAALPAASSAGVGCSIVFALLPWILLLMLLASLMVWADAPEAANAFMIFVASGFRVLITISFFSLGC